MLANNILSVFQLQFQLPSNVGEQETNFYILISIKEVNKPA